MRNLTILPWICASLFALACDGNVAVGGRNDALDGGDGTGGVTNGGAGGVAATGSGGTQQNTGGLLGAGGIDHAGPCTQTFNGTLLLLPPATMCRAPAGMCDVPEVCTGTSPDCPPDALLAAGNVCTPVSTPCISGGVCTGSSAECPATSNLPDGTACGDGWTCSAGTCVQPTPSNTLCAAAGGGVLAAGTVCRPTAGTCDVPESCDGTSAACPADGTLPPGTICRAQASACDAAEICDGIAITCPSDAPLADGTACDAGKVCHQGQCQ